MSADATWRTVSENSTHPGYCVMQWDGEQWCPLPAGNYCNAPHIPPDPMDLPPNGEPGTWETFACVPASGGNSYFATRNAASAPPMAAAAAASPAAAPASARPPVDRLNLIYHVYPARANDIWLRNVQQLRRRLPLFNGRMIVAIATGPQLVHPDEVQATFNWPGVEYLLVPNDAEVGEVASFPRLLAAIRSKDPQEATFYAHTKGASNTRDDAWAIACWRNAMYAGLLDDPQRVREALTRFAAVGACKTLHPHMLAFPSRIPWGHWHFAGTFFWFRHDRIFRDFRWPFVPHDRWGVEAWLGGFLSADETVSLIQPWGETDYTRNGYEPGVWEAYLGTSRPGNADATEPRISIIIPCKGRLNHLRQTLPYWLQQQFRPHEILVVDYGCPDGCGDWVQLHYPEVRVVRADPVSGFNVCRCRNLGAAHASGDYLAFADADFIAPPDYLQRMAEQIRAGKDLICIAHYDSGQMGLDGTCTVATRLYRQVHGYDESHPTYGFDDTDFYRRCEAAGATRGYLHNCQCLPHDDRERMRFYPEQDKATALERSGQWLAQQAAADSGVRAVPDGSV